MHIVRFLISLLLIVQACSAFAEKWSTSGDGMKCVPLRRADAVKLWIFDGERQTAVEGSEESAAKRGDHDWSHLFFSVEVKADGRIGHCMRLGWQVVPWGQSPADAADFGGRMPSGTVDLLYDAHHGE